MNEQEEWSAIHVPDILPPSEDWIFKSLLTHKDTPEILTDLLTSILGVTVKTAEVRNNEPAKMSDFEMQERFDVNCTIEDGTQIEIEMQSHRMENDTKENSPAAFIKRCLLYTTDLHSSQKSKSLTYSELVASYQIVFVNYTVFQGDGDFFRHGTVRDDKNREITKDFNLIFVELSKLGEVMKKSVEDMTPVEMWSMFFRCADNPERYSGVLREIETKKGAIKVAEALLKDMSRSQDERFRYRAKVKARNDEFNRMETSRRVGHREGKIEGIQEGIKEEKYVTARKLLFKKMTIEDIMDITDLPRSEIESIYL